MNVLIKALYDKVFLILFALPFFLSAQGSPVVLWEEPAHEQSIRAVAYSSDGEKVVSGSDYTESLAKIFNAANAELLDSFPDHLNGILSVDISNDNQYLAVGYIVTDYASSGEMRVYDLSTDTVIYTFPGAKVAFSPDSKLIASGGGGVTRDVYIHRISEGEQLHRFYNGSGYVNDVVFSPDGEYVAVACTDNTVKMWHLAGDSLLRSIPAHDDDVYAVAYSPDGQYLASAAGGWDEPGASDIKIWKTEDGSLFRSIEGHGDWVNDIEFSPDGLILLSAGRDGIGAEAVTKLKSWDVLSGELLYYYDQDFNGGVRDLAYSPDGGNIVYGRGDGYLVKALPPELGAVSSIDAPAPIAEQFRLEQNYPNPFNPVTTITYTVGSERAYGDTPQVETHNNASQQVTLTIHNVLGQKVATLVSENQPAGTYEVEWNAADAVSGIYFYKLAVGDFQQVRSMVLLK